MRARAERKRKEVGARKWSKSERKRESVCAVYTYVYVGSESERKTERVCARYMDVYLDMYMYMHMYVSVYVHMCV